MDEEDARAVAPFADSEATQYLWSLVQLVESGTGDPDALAASALEAIAGKEASALCDARAGPAVEKLVPLLAPAQVAALLAAVAAEAGPVCASGSGSRLVEALLARAASLLRSDRDDDGIAAAAGSDTESLCARVAALVDALQASAPWADVAYDANGSHVIRALLQLLPTLPPHNAALRRALHGVAAGVVASLSAEDGGGVAEAARDTHAGAALAAVLAALAPAPPLAAAAVAKVAAALGPDDARALACDPVGSHVVEGVLAAAPAEGRAFAGVYARWLRGAVAELAADRCGNHVVQRLLAAQGCSQAEAALAVGELLPRSVSELLPRADRAGVVMHAAEACQRHGVLERELTEAVRAAAISACASVNSEGPEAFAEALLLCPRTSYIASRTAQAILRMKRDVAKTFSASLVALRPEQLAGLSCDPAGSHVIEAALTSPSLPAPVKSRLVTALKGQLAEIACTAPGSRVVERCYAAADVSGKEAIAAELLVSERDLSNDFNGRFALRACKVRLYREKREAWRSAASHAAKKREMFSEIVNDGGSGSSSSGTRKLARPSSAAAPVAQLPGEYDEFMSVLGFGRSKKNEKAKKTPVAPASATKEEEQEAPAEAKAVEVTEASEEIEHPKDDDLSQAVVAALSKATGNPSASGKKKRKKTKPKKHDDGGDADDSAPKPQRRKFSMI